MNQNCEVQESKVRDMLFDLCLKVNDGCAAQDMQYQAYFGRYSKIRDDIRKFVLPKQPALAHEFVKLLDLAEFVKRAESLL